LTRNIEAVAARNPHVQQQHVGRQRARGPYGAEHIFRVANDRDVVVRREQGA